MNPVKAASIPWLFAKEEAAEEHPDFIHTPYFWRRKTAGIGKHTRLRRQLPNHAAAVGKRSEKRLVAATPRDRKKLKRVGKRGKRLAAGDKRWRERVWAVWGACIITGEAGPHVHAHHAYDKSYKPEWRHEVWNGILLRWDVHQKADEWPELHKALERVADECKAAADGIRPPVTRSEARSLIFDRCPRVRQYARPEEG